MLNNENEIWWSESLGARRDIINFALDGYTIFSDPSCSIVVPKIHGERLNRLLLSALKAYTLRLKSVDYVFKKYIRSVNLSSESNNFEKLLLKIIAEIRETYEAIADKHFSLKDLPDIPGLVAAGAALLRLNSSFKSACFLIQQGLPFEAMCVSKLILEQCAWAYVVHSIKNGDFFKIQPTSCIACLKELFPKSGHLYGELNKNAHIDPKIIHRLVRFEDGGVSVVYANPSEGLVASLYIMVLADIYGLVMEFIYKDYLKKFDFLVRNSAGIYIPNKKRKWLVRIKKNQEKIYKLLESEKISTKNNKKSEKEL